MTSNLWIRFRMMAVVRAVVCAVLATSSVVRAQQLDPSFNPGADGYVAVMVVQPDGKILVGGGFSMLGGGGTGATRRLYIGRLNADGSVDAGFDPGANGPVLAIALQPDGKILVGGGFTGLGGGTGTTPRNNLGRLNRDGSVDSGFNPGTSNPGTDGFSLSSVVRALVVQADGQILVGGDFTRLGGGTGTTVRNGIGRLNPDGLLDMGFNPGANGFVRALAEQANGQILVGGDFTKLGGGTGTTLRNRIGRLDSGGAIDTSFDPGADDTLYALAVQTNGQIVVGGRFTTLGGGGTGTTTRHRIGRLHSNGSLDSTFNPGVQGTVYALAEQADEKILVGGQFGAAGGGLGQFATLRSNIARLNTDGSLDMGFNPGAGSSSGALSYVYALAPQADGKILVGGLFTMLGGGGTGTTTRNDIGRLLTSSAASDAPSGLTGSVTGSIVTLSWLAPAAGGAPTAYILEAGSAPGLRDIVPGSSTGSPATTFTSGAVQNGLYYIRVRAVTAAGASGPSNEIPLRVGPAPPERPTGLTAAVAGSTVTLSWTAPAVGGLTGSEQDEATAGGTPTAYILEAGSAPGLRDRLPGSSTGSPATTFSLGGVPNGLYYVRVRATNAAGTSGPSDEISVRVGPEPPGAPGTPGGLTSQVVGSRVTLSWMKPTTGGEPGEYLIEAGATAGFPAPRDPGHTNSTLTTYTVSDVPDGTYYVRVRAWNASGTSGPSPEAQVVVGCTGPPNAPSAFMAQAGGWSAVFLSWTAPAGDPRNAPTTYMLEVRKDASILYDSFDLGQTTTDYSRSGVDSGTYFVRIVAKNKCGTSPASNEKKLVVFF